MRKLILSVLGLVCAGLYAAHAVYAAGLMLGIFPFSLAVVFLGIVLAVLLFVHAVLGLPFALWNTCRSGRRYAALNKGAYTQYVTGVLLIVYMFYHAEYLTHQPSLLKLAVIVVTLAATGIHMFIGMPKSLITLGGIRSGTGMAKARIVAGIITLAPTAICVAAYFLYYPQYYGGN